MTPRQRSAHRWIWLLGAPLLLVAAILLVLRRPPPAISPQAPAIQNNSAESRP